MLVGCSGSGDVLHLAKPVSSIDVPQAEYNLPPRQLYDAAKRAAEELSLPVQQEKSGTFITGWKAYPGEWHIARRWQEQTRFRVSVIPDFENPSGKARLEVAEETQTREADGMSWKQLTDLNRPERAKELLKQIEQRIKGAPATRPQ